MQFNFEKQNIDSYSSDEFKYFLFKGVTFVILFAILHQLHMFSEILAITISEVNESLFQHFKMGFILWLFLMIVELVLFRKKIEDMLNFIFSRIFVVLLISWLIFIVWNILPMVTQNFTPAVEVEISWSFIATFVAGFIGAMIEHSFLRINLNKELKLVMTLLCIILYIQFVLYSMNIPPDWLFFEGPGAH